MGAGMILFVIVMFWEYLQANLVLFGELPSGEKRSCAHDVENQRGELVIHQAVWRVDPKEQERKLRTGIGEEWGEGDEWEEDHSEGSEGYNQPYYHDGEQMYGNDYMDLYNNNEYEDAYGAQGEASSYPFSKQGHQGFKEQQIPPEFTSLILQQAPHLLPTSQHHQLLQQQEQEEQDESWETEEEEEEYLEADAQSINKWPQRRRVDDFQ